METFAAAGLTAGAVSCLARYCASFGTLDLFGNDTRSLATQFKHLLEEPVQTIFYRGGPNDTAEDRWRNRDGHSWDDIERAAEFYAAILGLEKMEGNERFCAFSAGGRDVFLLFRSGGSTQPIQIPGGTIPPHGGSGPLHFAFAIAETDWDLRTKHLESYRVAIESVVRWPRGGRSIYIRDPDNHLVELATPGTWPNY